jgi:hypothetical protein
MDRIRAVWNNARRSEEDEGEAYRYIPKATFTTKDSWEVFDCKTKRWVNEVELLQIPIVNIEQERWFDA